MAVDLALIHGLPGGPYRMTIAETPDGTRFGADEMCACPDEDGPHWHEVIPPIVPSFSDLVIELLIATLQGVPK